MKIYRFGPETGVYLGEDFADEAMMENRRFFIPGDATTIAPPEVDHGQILFFNSIEQRWDIHANPRGTPANEDS